MELTPMMTIKQYAEALNVDITNANDFALGGIYDAIGASWWAEIMGDDRTILNLEYFSRSGNKQISPLLELLKDNDNISTKVAQVIVARFLKKWKGMYDTLNLEYNPLYNYYRKDKEHTDIVENEKNNGENHTTSSDESKSTKTDTVSPYNDGGWKDDSQTIDEDNSGSQNDSENSNNRDLDHDKDRELTSEGRIGTMSVQAMIENEYKLRRKNLHEEILQDIDEVLTCPLY